MIERSLETGQILTGRIADDPLLCIIKDTPDRFTEASSDAVSSFISLSLIDFTAKYGPLFQEFVEHNDGIAHEVIYPWGAAQNAQIIMRVAYWCAAFLSKHSSDTSLHDVFTVNIEKVNDSIHIIGQMNWGLSFLGDPYYGFLDLSPLTKTNQASALWSYAGISELDGTSSYITSAKVVAPEAIQKIRPVFAHRGYVDDYETWCGIVENSGVLMLAIEALIENHVRNFSFIFKDGCLTESPPNLLTYLWKCFAYQYSHQKIATCKGCGKPFNAFGERKNPKLYCGELCRKKHQYHQRKQQQPTPTN